MSAIAKRSTRLSTGTSGTVLLACERRAASISARYTPEEDACIRKALGIIGLRMKNGPVFSSPEEIGTFLILKASEIDHEVFWVLFTDAHCRLITVEAMFRGTLTQTSVHPREIVKRALELNAGAVILAHNHPSGDAMPSRCDERLTQAVKTALSLVDVRVLDHVIVAGDRYASMAVKGLL